MRALPSILLLPTFAIGCALSHGAVGAPSSDGGAPADASDCPASSTEPAVGPFGFVYRQSEGGVAHAPGAALVHDVELQNGTSEPLALELRAEARAVTGSWAGAASFVAGDGAHVELLELDSGARVPLRVRVAAPPDAAEGEPIALSLTASACGIGRASTYEITDLLRVSALAGEPVRGYLRARGARLLPSGAVPPASIVQLQFALAMESAVAPPHEGALELTIEPPSDLPIGTWVLRDEDSGRELAPVAPGRYVRSMTLGSSDGDPLVIRLRAEAPATEGRWRARATASTAVASTDFEPLEIAIGH